MQARAEARYLRTSPQKARLVIDLIRGQRAGDAINILRTTNKRIAPSIEKVLRSAIANAENRSNDVDVDKLMVIECYVNEGPGIPVSAAHVPHHCEGRRRKDRGKELNGSESTSLRIPAGRHQDVAVAMV